MSINCNNNDITEIKNKLKSFVFNKNKLPYYHLDDLSLNKNEIKYINDVFFQNNICHLGQRKLLLTEIEFYNKCIKFNENNNIVIYAGSALGEHQTIIAKMFPKLKFILIDPNYHSFSYKYK